jgi:potassium-dependent mechanosensitive channel
MWTRSKSAKAKSRDIRTNTWDAGYPGSMLNQSLPHEKTLRFRCTILAEPGHTAVRRAIRIVLLLTFCWAASGSMAEAQQASASQVRPSSAATPIPVFKIASEAGSALEPLHEIAASLTSDQTTVTVADGLSGLTSQIETQIVEDIGLLRSKPPLQVLYRLRLTWQSFGAKVSAWNSELTRSGISLDEQLARLDELDKIWQLTLQSVKQAGAPPEVLQRVQAVIDSIRGARQAVDSRRAQVLSLQNRAYEEAGRIRTTLTLIEQSENRALQGVLSRDSPPIWSPKTGVQEEWTKNSPQSLSAQLSALTAYAKRLPFTFLMHVLIILVLAVAIHWLRRRVRKWSEREPSLQRVAPVFALPVSAALALSCLFSRWSLYPGAPRLLLAVIGAAALIPTVLVLRRLLEGSLFPILNALVIMYFVDQLREIGASLPLLARVLFLAQMLGAMLFLFWLIHGRHLPTATDKANERLSRAMRAGVWIGLLVFSAAFLTNIFGYVNLANLLGSTFLWSAYLVAILYVAIRIADGLIIIALQIGPLASLRVVQLHRPMLHRRMCSTLEFLAFLFWLDLMLNFFGLRTQLIENIEAVLNASLAIGSLSISLGHVLTFLVTVWASFLFSKFLRFLLEEDIYHHFHLGRGIPEAISTMVHYAVLLLGFFVAMGALGVDLNKFTILAGAFTVGVGFGLQNIINNFVSGLILLFERPIKVGDVIEVSGNVGEVRRIGIRASVIRTPDGSEVIVPNGTLISSQVTNWTFSDQHRAVEVPVTVVRGTAPQRVVELLVRVAANHPRVAKEPTPQAYVVNFASGAVTFQLRAWTDRYEDWVQVRSDLSIAVDDALTRENIGIP